MAFRPLRASRWSAKTAIHVPTLDLGYGYDSEFSSDVEWAHAIAPNASIVVVEWSYDAGSTDTLAGVIATAKNEAQLSFR